MMKNLIIVKIGGNIIDDEKKLDLFLTEFSKLKTPKILVHGGGKIATELATKLGIKTKLINGRRVTDKDTLKITTMVYAGWLNKTITAKLNALKTKAIGLTGADAGLICSTKRKTKPINYGFVGDLNSSSINAELIHSFLHQSLVPVFCAITADKGGQLLNTNADTIASNLAVSLAKTFKTKLIYGFEKDGVMNKTKVIQNITKKQCDLLKKEKIITNGMIPKIDNAFKALQKGVDVIYIGNALKLKLLLSDKSGTKITHGN